MEFEGTSLKVPTKSLASRYTTLSSLGSGSFGSVHLARLKEGVATELIQSRRKQQGTMLYPMVTLSKASTGLVAIKTLTRQLKRHSDYNHLKEVTFIYSIQSHFNLVQIYDVFIDDLSGKLNIVMETMDQNLYQLMKYRRGCTFSSNTLKSVLSQLLAAIIHIHKHLFFHRDIKPENILISNASSYFGSKINIPPLYRGHSYILKLADYGLARHAQNSKAFTSYVSTRWYRSPEILLRKGSYSFPIDIWAFGCVAVECANFTPLFPGVNELDQTIKVIKFLGSPTISPYSNNQSFGGYWPEAIQLAHNLDININTKSLGTHLESIIVKREWPNYEKQLFFELVKGCLVWDPMKRMTALSICHMNYFKNSLIDIENQNQKENGNYFDYAYCHRNLANDKFNNAKLKMMKSRFFAGIPSIDTSRQLNSNGNISNFSYLVNDKNSININPSYYMPNFSNIKKLNVYEPGLGNVLRDSYFDNNNKKLSLHPQYGMYSNLNNIDQFDFGDFPCESESEVSNNNKSPNDLLAIKEPVQNTRNQILGELEFLPENLNFNNDNDELVKIIEKETNDGNHSDNDYNNDYNNFDIWYDDEQNYKREFFAVDNNLSNFDSISSEYNETNKENSNPICNIGNVVNEKVIGSASGSASVSGSGTGSGSGSDELCSIGFSHAFKIVEGKKNFGFDFNSSNIEHMNLIDQINYTLNEDSAMDSSLYD
ncbi:protein kinase [Martiniozyma asiatica (nom. inval.)]|nr:protein kinase [Martiniozyma asiatica]